LGEKTRIDVLLVKKGLLETREKAKTTIMAGMVYVDNQKVDKPGTLVDEDLNIEVRGDVLPYVSRGGLKLEKALKSFHISLQGKKAMDIGASTGGFTDCMLQNGASKVYSVDVGYGQLAWKLRQDERVINMERTNVRYLKPEQIGEELDFISIDVSFISLKLVLPVAKSILKEDGEIVCLVKPQFEAGREKVGKKGVVRDKNVHIKVIETIIDFVQSIDLSVIGLDYSPVKGPEGNIEYLLYLKKKDGRQEGIIDSMYVRRVVELSHELL